MKAANSGGASLCWSVILPIGSSAALVFRLAAAYGGVHGLAHFLKYQLNSVVALVGIAYDAIVFIASVRTHARTAGAPANIPMTPTNKDAQSGPE